MVSGLSMALDFYAALREAREQARKAREGEGGGEVVPTEKENTHNTSAFFGWHPRP